MNTQPLVLLLDDEAVFLEIASLQPDLVLSDVYMTPAHSGWEFALALGRNPKTRDVKIAFFTSLHDPWLELKKEEQEKVIREVGQISLFSKTDDAKTFVGNIS